MTSLPDEASVDGSNNSKPDELVGTVFAGRYELNSILGTGGMGVIYLGRQIFLDRPVAVKVLKGADISPKARMRFHKEAKAACSLSHPGIVSIIDFGVDEADRPYMVMEFVEGVTLSDLLAERLILPLEDCLPVFLEVCDALGAAHKKNIVHRDVKPSNIMLVVSDDDVVHIKLLDFGIAKLLDLTENTLQDLTKTGDTLGTPLYMSPEQIDSKTVTYRSDLYSLGCTMYACLTGAPPFIGASHIQTMEMHCTDEPMSLEEASEGVQYPEALQDIITRLLAKSPADRFDSAEQVKQALLSMAAAITVKDAKLDAQDFISFSDWSDTTHGMSKSVSQSVHSSMAGRARLAPVRTQHEQEPSGDDSVFWESDLSTRMAEANGRRRKSNVRLGSVEQITTKGSVWSSKKRILVLSSLTAFALILCGLGAFYSFNRSPIAFVSILTAPPKTRVPTRSFLPSAAVQILQPRAISSPDSDVSSADTVIENTVSSKPGVKELSLAGMYGLTSKGLRKLHMLKNLEVLDLSETGITNADLKPLFGLKIKELFLAGNEGISDWGLFEVSSLPNLARLGVWNTKITDAGLKYLSRARNLKSLAVSNNEQITSAGIANLNPSSSSLEKLDLSGCSMDNEVAKDLLKFKNLKSVIVTNNKGISNSFLALLSTKAKNFKQLRIVYTSIGTMGYARLDKFTSLEILAIGSAPLGESGIEMLSHMQNLRTLYLYECLNDKQLKLLKAALPKTDVVKVR